MPLPFVYAQVRIVVADEGLREYENILFFEPGPGVTPTIDTAYAQTFAMTASAGFNAQWKAVMATTCTFLGASVRVNDHGSIYTDDNTTNLGPGTVAGDHLPNSDAVVLDKGTAAPGRPGRGRWFIPLVPELYTTGNALTVPGRTAYQGLASVLAGAFVTGGDSWVPCMLSRTNDTLLPLVFTRVTTLIRRQGRRAVRPLIL